MIGWPLHGRPLAGSLHGTAVVCDARRLSAADSFH